MRLFISSRDNAVFGHEPNAETMKPLKRKVATAESTGDIWAHVAQILNRDADSIRMELTNRHMTRSPIPTATNTRNSAPTRPLPTLTLAPAPVKPPKPMSVISMMLSMDPVTAMSDGRTTKPIQPDRNQNRTYFNEPVRRNTFQPIDVSWQPTACAPPNPKSPSPEPGDDDCTIRPESPGREVDSWFVPAEIGQHAPRFKKAKYQDLFGSCTNKEDFTKIMKQVNGVERTLDQRYKDICKIKEVEQRMIEQQSKLFWETHPRSK
jgi:hypothetical protein